jgi:hypothetical protein
MEPLEARLSHLVAGTPWLMRLLQVVREAGPQGSYVAAGAIRNSVWDSLHGRPPANSLADIDVVYFDPSATEVDWAQVLGSALPGYLWDVTNQATIHEWQSVYYGRAVSPYGSVAEALESWTETATAVGVRLNGSGGVDVVAPFGLVDLFQLRVRPSPKVLDLAAYQARVRAKAWQRRWPRLHVLSS